MYVHHAYLHEACNYLVVKCTQIVMNDLCHNKYVSCNNANFRDWNIKWKNTVAYNVAEGEASATASIDLSSLYVCMSV